MRIKIGRAQIPVIFRDFIFQDQMIAECIPREIGDDAVILMTVIPKMRKNKVWIPRFQSLKERLDICTRVREKPITEIFDNYLFSLAPAKNDAALALASSIRDPVALKTTRLLWHLGMFLAA